MRSYSDRSESAYFPIGLSTSGRVKPGNEASETCPRGPECPGGDSSRNVSKGSTEHCPAHIEIPRL